MSSTAFEQIAQAVKAKLLEAPALAGGRIYLNLDRALPATTDSAVNIVLGDSNASETALGAHDWSTQIDVECYARGTSTASDDDAADALLSVVWTRLHSFSPAGLGLMSFAIEPSIRRDRAAQDRGFACFTVRAVAEHRTPVDSLAPWP